MGTLPICVWHPTKTSILSLNVILRPSSSSQNWKLKHNVCDNTESDFLLHDIALGFWKTWRLLANHPYMISTITRRLYKSYLLSSTSLLHQLLGSLFPKSVSIPAMCGRDTQSLKTKSAWEKASTRTYQKNTHTFRLLCSKAPSKWSPLRSHVWKFGNYFHTTNAALCVISISSSGFSKVVLDWWPKPSWDIETYKTPSNVLSFSSLSHDVDCQFNLKMIPYRLHVL